MQSETPDMNVLVWLPSPMGDAILSTPALRAIRRYCKTSRICFLANPVVREVLSPGNWNDVWLEYEDGNPLAIAALLRKHKFAQAILLKNSFASAAAVFLAGIPVRIGYSREKRGFFLTERLHPPKLANGKFRPMSMVDYYLGIASRLGADIGDKNLELSVEPSAARSLKARLPELASAEGPVVAIVPGGAFGPSKMWPSSRFAETADWLIANYRATVIVSVAPDQAERQIAAEICNLSRGRPINLADRPLSLGELKALFSLSDLVITNDTGPRHIALALRRKVVTLFGPNDPAWTQTESQSEIRIVGNVPCGPCGKPRCGKPDHLCMNAITVEMVRSASKELLEGGDKSTTIKTQRELVETSDSFFVDPAYEPALGKLGLKDMDEVFSYKAGTSLAKHNLARYRSRVRLEINALEAAQRTTLFLKRYENPPVSLQLRNWLAAHRRASCGLLEFASASLLAAFGIGTPRTVCCGEQWAGLFEKRSFTITEKIPDAESLERKLPDCLTSQPSQETLRLRRDFICSLADFIRQFHQTGYRHRDLYLAHIFHSDNGTFYLIDLARAFRPFVLSRRFQVKDVAQIHYSAPGRYFSRTDRLRFYLRYAQRSRLSGPDKTFIRAVANKASRMACHDRKHSREVPFEN